MSNCKTPRTAGSIVFQHQQARSMHPPTWSSPGVTANSKLRNIFTSITATSCAGKPPPSGSAPGTLETRYWKAPQTVKVCEQATPEALPEVAAASSSSTLGLRVYVGPKDYDDLKKMNPPLQGLVNFGWLEFIAEPLFHGLKWLHSYIPNWGWAIVALTLILNMLLFPLRLSGYKTT